MSAGWPREFGRHSSCRPNCLCLPAVADGRVVINRPEGWAFGVLTLDQSLLRRWASEGALDIRRHAPLGRRRFLSNSSGVSSGTGVSGGSGPTRARGRHGDIFSDAGTSPTSKVGGFRWIVSTTLAAAVGAISVAAVVFGSGDRRETELALRQILAAPGAMNASAVRTLEPQDKGLRWAIPKADRLQNMSDALLGRFLVHDTMRVKRGNRDVIVNKGFVRLVARLAPVSSL